MHTELYVHIISSNAVILCPRPMYMCTCVLGEAMLIVFEASKHSAQGCSSLRSHQGEVVEFFCFSPNKGIKEQFLQCLTAIESTFIDIVLIHPQRSLLGETEHLTQISQEHCMYIPLIPTN